MRLDSAMCVAAEVCEVPDGVQRGGGDEGSVVSVVDTVHDQRLDFDSIVLIQEWGRGMWWGRGERDPGAGMTESPFFTNNDSNSESSQTKLSQTVLLFATNANY